MAVQNPRVIVIYGPNGTRKSTIALSVKGKKWYAETDPGSFWRANGDVLPEGEVEVHYYPPIIDWAEEGILDTTMVGAKGSGPVQIAHTLNGWTEQVNQFRREFGKATQDPSIDNMIVDTQTNLFDMLMNGQKEVFQKQLGIVAAGMKRPEYSELNLKMKQFGAGAKAMGKNLIMVAHQTEIWLNNEPTGEFKSDGWKRMEDESDITLRMSRQGKTTVAHIAKAGGADLALIGRKVEVNDLNEVIELMDAARYLRNEQPGVALPESNEDILERAKNLKAFPG